MKCIECGKKTKKVKTGLYHYSECGLSKVFLKGMETLQCSNKECGEEELIIPNIEKLHEVISMKLASQKNKLLPEEIKYLRTYLGFSGIGFAKKIKVSPETVSRWENGRGGGMKETTELSLRLLVLSKSGPFRDYENLENFATSTRRTPVKRQFFIKKQNWEAIAA